jgi:hypothetical protein
MTAAIPSIPRTVAWFSAGAASAVAAKLVPEAAVVYIDPGSEHPDNGRFIADVSRWLNRPIETLRSERYRDTWQVWAERRFLVGPAGALCTTEMKKRPRYAYERPDDIQVFGYTSEERHRAERFEEQNPGVTLRCPLIERGLTKDDCLAIIDRAGIDLPVMYRLGFRNNNCVGCPKGGMGYWNHIRRHFPEVFDRMARVERDLNHSILHDKNGPVWLDALDPNRGSVLTEAAHECSVSCASVEADLAETPVELGAQR